MSADRDALFARIMEDPDDDAPRLIYSDILEEDGDADRAEFIRLQIRFARMAADDPARKAVNDRIRDLELEFGVKWLSEMPYTPGVHWEIFERGFISTARFDNPDRFFEYAPAVFASTPISRLRLHQFFSDDVRRMAPLPLLNQIKELDLEDGCRAGNAGVNALMEAGQLKALEALKLRGNNLGPSAMWDVSAMPGASRLTYLDVSNNDLYNDGLQALSGMSAQVFGRPGTRLTNLRYLRVANCRLDDEALDVFTDWKVTDSLRSLHLSGNALDGRGLRPLSIPEFPTLRSVFADRCSLDEGSFIQFLSTVQMPKLRWFYLRNNLLSDAAAAALAASDRLPGLRDLILGENRVTRIHLPALQAKYGPGVIVD